MMFDIPIPSLLSPPHQPNADLDHPQIVVTACLRTAFTKGGKGGFKDTAAADLLVGAFKSLIQRSQIDPALVEDIAVGSVLPPGGGATEFRAAALAAGFPVSAAVKSLNRQCSSGLQACVDIANAISSGMIEVGVGAGVESMSLQYGYVCSTFLWIPYLSFVLDGV
jgi:acetyl-CoA acyltransferase 1